MKTVLHGVLVPIAFQMHSFRTLYSLHSVMHRLAPLNAYNSKAKRAFKQFGKCLLGKTGNKKKRCLGIGYQIACSTCILCKHNVLVVYRPRSSFLHPFTKQTSGFGYNSYTDSSNNADVLWACSARSWKHSFHGIRRQSWLNLRMGNQISVFRWLLGVVQWTRQSGQLFLLRWRIFEGCTHELAAKGIDFGIHGWMEYSVLLNVLCFVDHHCLILTYFYRSGQNGDNIFL